MFHIGSNSVLTLHVWQLWASKVQDTSEVCLSVSCSFIGGSLEKLTFSVSGEQSLLQSCLLPKSPETSSFLVVPLRPPEQRVSRRVVSGLSRPSRRWRSLRSVLLFLLHFILCGSHIICWAVVVMSAKVATKSLWAGLTVLTCAPSLALVENVHGGDFLQGVQPVQRHHGSRRGALAEARAPSWIGDLWHGLLII